VKKCPRCSKENTDAMNFCLECGTPLGVAPSTASPTASFPTEIVTNPPQSRETQTVVTNFPPPTQEEPKTVVTNFPPTQETKTVVNQSYFPPPTPNFSATPNLSPPSPPQKSSKTLLIVGGLIALLVLGGIGVVGIGVVVLYSRSGNDPMPTPPPPKVTPVVPATPILPSTPTKTKTPTDPQNTEHSADYEDMRVDFNVKEGGQLGMRMNVSFTTNNLKGVESYLAIYLQNTDGTPINGKMPAFRSKTGQVAVFKLLRPAYDVAEYKDLQLFIPYTAFGLPKGKYNLQLNVNVIYKTDGLIKQLTVYDFEFEQK